MAECYLDGDVGDRAGDYRPVVKDSEAGGRLGAGRPHRWWRILRVFAGFLLLLLGFIGLFLPVLQGILLILAGLGVLGRDLPWARAVTDRLASFVRRRAAKNPGRPPADAE